MPRFAISRPVVDQLSESTWAELWRFAEEYTEGTEAGFRTSLRSKKYVVLIRDARSRALVGMGGVDVYPIEHEARRILVIYSGNLIFAPGVRGQSIVQREGFRVYLETRLRHPRTPVWLFYDTFSFKSYLMLPNNFREFWPRHDRPTPPAIRDLLDRLGQHRYGTDWDAARGICRRGGRRLKAGVATITEEMLANEHIRYFHARNPGYRDGDMLAVLVPLTAGNWLGVLARAAVRMRRVPAAGR